MARVMRLPLIGLLPGIPSDAKMHGFSAKFTVHHAFRVCAQLGAGAAAIGEFHQGDHFTFERVLIKFQCLTGAAEENNIGDRDFIRVPFKG